MSPVGGPLDAGNVLVEYDSDTNPRTLAHELMHYLGLWHLTETAQPDIHDPIGDTPHYDDSNLMSPGLDGGFSLTDQQRDIARRHPILVGGDNRCE